MEERRLEQSGTCVPNLPAQHQGKLWCDEKYWNMEYGKEQKGEPYFSNCVPEIGNCTRPKTKGYDYIFNFTIITWWLDDDDDK